MSGKSESYPLALPVADSLYRTLLFFAGYGKAVAYLAGIIMAAGGLVLWWAGHGPAWAVAGIGLGCFTTLLLNCLAELVHLIVDTMIPK